MSLESLPPIEPVELTLQNILEDIVFSRRGSEEKTSGQDSPAEEVSEAREDLVSDCQEEVQVKSKSTHLQHLLVRRRVFEDPGVTVECTPL